MVHRHLFVDFSLHESCTCFYCILYELSNSRYSSPTSLSQHLHLTSIPTVPNGLLVGCFCKLEAPPPRCMPNSKCELHRGFDLPICYFSRQQEGDVIFSQTKIGENIFIHFETLFLATLFPLVVFARLGDAYFCNIIITPHTNTQRHCSMRPAYMALLNLRF